METELSSGFPLPMTMYHQRWFRILKLPTQHPSLLAETSRCWFTKQNHKCWPNSAARQHPWRPWTGQVMFWVGDSSSPLAPSRLTNEGKLHMANECQCCQRFTSPGNELSQKVTINLHFCVKSSLSFSEGWDMTLHHRGSLVLTQISRPQTLLSASWFLTIIWTWLAAFVPLSQRGVSASYSRALRIKKSC